MATATTVMEPSVKISANKLLINGQWVNSASGKTFPTINPATGEVITQVAEADAADDGKAELLHGRRGCGVLFVKEIFHRAVNLEACAHAARHLRVEHEKASHRKCVQVVVVLLADRTPCHGDRYPTRIVVARLKREGIVWHLCHPQANQ